VSFPEIAIVPKSASEKNFLDLPVVESDTVFQAIETATPEVVEQVIGNTDTQEERKRKLPSQLVVCLVLP